MVSQTEVIAVIKSALYTVMAASAPMLAVALSIGLIVSIFQATTQINEQTLAFVPKILGIFVTLLVCGGWIITLITDFTTELYQSINTMLG